MLFIGRQFGFESTGSEKLEVCTLFLLTKNGFHIFEAASFFLQIFKIFDVILSCVRRFFYFANKLVESDLHIVFRLGEYYFRFSRRAEYVSRRLCYMFE